MNVTVFLQNAWSPIYAGRKWHRRLWLKVLHSSRSGQRLRTITSGCPDVSFWFDNTTPEVGDHPDSVLPANVTHVRKVLSRTKPRAVVAMGNQAAAALRLVVPGDMPLLILPHPTYRVLSNRLLVRAAKLIAGGFDGVVELKQGKGKVRTCKR